MFGRLLQMWRNAQVDLIIVAVKHHDMDIATWQRWLAMQADTLGQTDTTEAATAALQQEQATAELLAPRMSANHGSHDEHLHMSTSLYSSQPGATSCCSSSSPDSHAMAGSKQHDANSGSTVHERNTAPAKAGPGASRSAAQALDAEELFASWHGRPAPSPAPPHCKEEPQTRRKRCAAAVFISLLHPLPLSSLYCVLLKLLQG